MDFKQLMKQAAINQSSKVKKFEQLKEREKEEKATAIEKKIKDKQKASDKLKRYETDLIKSKLTYNGLLNKKGEPLTDKAKRQLEEVTLRTKTPPTKTTSIRIPPTKIPPNKTSLKTPSTGVPPNKTSLKTPPTATPTSTKNKVTTNLSIQKNKSKSTSPRPMTTVSGVQKVKSQSGDNLKSKTPPPRLKKPPGPVNFKDLMKIAQKNHQGGGGGPLAAVTDKREELERQHTTSVGIGKAILTRRDDKTKTDKQPVLKQPIASSNGDKLIPPSHHETNDKKKDYPYGRPPSLKEQTLKTKDYPYGPPPNRTLVTKGSSTSSLPTTAAMSQTRGKLPEGEINKRKIAATSNNKVLKSKSFYGSHSGTLPSSARLIKDGPSRGSSLLQYKSVWVDEMRDYLQNNTLDFDSEEEEEDDEMDDFVVDEENEEGDYSSAIQEIFGSRYRNRVQDEEEDDQLMESSYTQQQFEEYRSARIGEREDAEELKREQEMMRRKRNKSTPSNQSTKKMKH